MPARLSSFAGIVLLLLSWVSGLGVGFCTAQQPSPDRLHPVPSTIWVQGEHDGIRPRWGIAGGLMFGIHPGDKKGDGEPRGLIRIFSPVLPGEKYDLINFIAVEPIVEGRRGFSEMEQSRLDRAAGKRMWTAASPNSPGNPAKMEPGKITRLPSGVEQLELTLRVEKFDNGTHVYLVVTQRSDAPDEIELTLHTEPDGKTPEYVMLSATMGNKARALAVAGRRTDERQADLPRFFRRWFR